MAAGIVLGKPGRPIEQTPASAYFATLSKVAVVVQFGNEYLKDLFFKTSGRN